MEVISRLNILIIGRMQMKKMSLFMNMLNTIMIWSLLLGTARAEVNPFHVKGYEKLFGHIGDGLVATQLTLGFVDAYKHKEVKCWAARNIVGFASNELLKRVIHRNRPDKSDNKSFPSMHTMFGSVNVTKGWTYSITFSIALSRNAADKHYITDVLGGFGLGILARRVCE